MMHHIKATTVLPYSGDRVESFYWASGGSARVQTRTALHIAGSGVHWSGVDTFTPDRGVAAFFRGMAAKDGVTVASVR